MLLQTFGDGLFVQARFINRPYRLRGYADWGYDGCCKDTACRVPTAQGLRSKAFMSEGDTRFARIEYSVSSN